MKHYKIHVKTREMWEILNTICNKAYGYAKILRSDTEGDILWIENELLQSSKEWAAKNDQHIPWLAVSEYQEMLDNMSKQDVEAFIKQLTDLVET